MNEYISKWVSKIPNIQGHEDWVGALLLSAAVLLLAFIVFFIAKRVVVHLIHSLFCLLYTSPSPRDLSTSRMPSSA